MAGSDGVLASNLIQEAGGNNIRQENMRSEFMNSVQIEKLQLTFRCYHAVIAIFREANSNSRFSVCIQTGFLPVKLTC